MSWCGVPVVCFSFESAPRLIQRGFPTKVRGSTGKPFRPAHLGRRRASRCFGRGVQDAAFFPRVEPAHGRRLFSVRFSDQLLSLDGISSSGRGKKLRNCPTLILGVYIIHRAVREEWSVHACRRGRGIYEIHEGTGDGWARREAHICYHYPRGPIVDLGKGETTRTGRRAGKAAFSRPLSILIAIANRLPIVGAAPRALSRGRQRATITGTRIGPEGVPDTHSETELPNRRIIIEPIWRIGDGLPATPTPTGRLLRFVVRHAPDLLCCRVGEDPGLGFSVAPPATPTSLVRVIAPN